MMLTIPPKVEINGDDGFSEENDIFQRKGFGERIAKFIENQKDGITIGIDGKWGEGKSTFIEMWKGHVQYHREKKLKCIYFDAFENDYQKDPFFAIAAEIYNLIKDENSDKQKEFIEKTTNALKSFTRGALKIGIRVATSGILDGSVLDTVEKEFSDLVSDEADKLIASKLIKAKEDKLSIQNFKTYLATFAENESSGGPIVFIIDELDRCRPDFSIELLEYLKHIFTVKGFVFVLLTNRDQLEEIIKCKYGVGINASQYLQKFVNVWLDLPKVIDPYKNLATIYTKYTLDRMLAETDKVTNRDMITVLLALVKQANPSFREIEKCLTYIAILNSIVDSEFNSMFQVLSAFICLCKATNPSICKKIIDKKITFEELLSQMNLPNIGHNSKSSEIDHILNCIKYDLSNETTKSEMISNKTIYLQPQFGNSSDIMVYICNSLNNFKTN